MNTADIFYNCARFNHEHVPEEYIQTYMSLLTRSHWATNDRRFQGISQATRRKCFRDILRIFPYVTVHVSIPMIIKFCKARHWNFDDTTHAIESHIEWKKEVKYDELNLIQHLQNAQRIIHSGVGFYNGKDKKDNFLFYVNIKYYCHPKDEDGEPSKKAEIWTSEEMISSIIADMKFLDIIDRYQPERTQKVTLVINLDKCGIYQHAFVNLFQEALTVSQANNPERIAKILILNAPWYFSAAIRTVQMFLSKDTNKKLRLIHDKSDLLRYISRDVLLAEYGGTNMNHLANLNGANNATSHHFQHLNRIINSYASSDSYENNNRNEVESKRLVAINESDIVSQD